MPHNNQYSIHDAAQAAGLTPSVIRVWEERYGWPSPKRHRNGYRAFAEHEIEELKRAAALVKGGMPIGKLIVDGFPQWPDDGKQHHSKPHDLSHTKSLPLRAGRAAEQLRDSVVDGLNRLHGGQALEAVQRACIELRPADEVAAVLAPALIGLTEIAQSDRAVSHDVEVRKAVATRCRQLRQRLPTQGLPIIVAPATDSDNDFAALVVTVLATRGVHAQLGEHDQAAYLASESVPTPAERHLPHITALPCEGCVPLAQLLDPQRTQQTVLQVEAQPALSN